MRDHNLIEYAKKMRREMTSPEQALWLALRAKRFAGAKFRRQVVIDRYIFDFACRRPLMLVIEVDGDTHAESRAYDASRTSTLEERGYRVVRFLNSDVMSNLEGVLLAIGEALGTPPLPDPLP
ncbi:endonuclease domain-containing protein [Sphingosinicella sp. BN140058]|uniref:endonuclease domain-containing protein n=1 Tax=Sphingosinicella sp. BN140058 TaxID=1892855 RepID=UPI0026C42CB7